MRLIFSGLAALILSGPALAETAYVTDNLRLGLHQAADTSDRSFRTLESGHEIEVLTRDRNYAHVQLSDGVQGYVKAAYLVYEKPAKLIVAETQEFSFLTRQILQRKTISECKIGNQEQGDYQQEDQQTNCDRHIKVEIMISYPRGILDLTPSGK